MSDVRARLFEVPPAIRGPEAGTHTLPMFPDAMGFAVGGMPFVISDVITPGTHVRGHERAATAGTMHGSSRCPP